MTALSDELLMATIPSYLISSFSSSYDSSDKDRVWKEQSRLFREFWENRVMGDGTDSISDEDCDPIIRILDKHGKGNTKGSEAVAKAMVAQGAWRRMFNEFRTDKKFGAIVDTVLKASSEEQLAQAIDRLYEYNAGRRNFITGPSGNVVGALLAAYNPEKNLSIISLGDREKLYRFLEPDTNFNWQDSSIGQRIAESNQVLLEAMAKHGVSGSARTVSVFCYVPEMSALWKGGHTSLVPAANGNAISVTVPTEIEESSESDNNSDLDVRESILIQSYLADIGARMGLKIWLPKSDRARVLKNWSPEDGTLLEQLPIINEESVLKTVEQIDVIWLKGRSIIRAFEVEHTTSVYSGLLRMADLLALQPNLSINLHIVAPSSRRDKVFSEILRPVFQLMEGGPLSEKCSYISYDNVKALRDEKRLGFMSPDVVEDIAENAEDDF